MRRMKKKPAERIEKGPVHVAVGNPEEIRINLLEGAKQSIMLMQRRDRLERIREEKKSLFETFKILLKEMNYLNNKISQALPKMKMGAAEAKRAVEKIDEIGARQQSQQTWQVSRIDELEMELKEIEGRIRSLR